MKKIFAGILSLLMIIGLAGCDKIPMPGFEDYDVSGYIAGLLDSTYLDEHEKYMEFSKSTLSSAEKNHSITVENATSYLCSLFKLYPDDTQLDELNKVMSEAYKLSRYTVKEKVKSPTGYYIEVDIQPLLAFKESYVSVENLRREIENNASKTSYTEDVSENDDEYGDDEDIYDADELESYREARRQDEPDPAEQQSELVEGTIKIFREALFSPNYGASRTITMDIRVNDAGELSLDKTQLELIDETVVLIETR